MTNAEREEIFSKEILTADDIAKLFGCSKRTAYDVIANIKLRYNRLGKTIGGSCFAGKVHVQDYLDCYGLDRNSPRYSGKENGTEYSRYTTVCLPDEDRKKHYFYPSVMKG